jgi:hypothetical protein
VNEVEFVDVSSTDYLEDKVLKTMRIAAARSGKHDYEAVEESLRAYIGLELLETVAARSSLSEAEALDIAYEELHQGRT